ncbi:DUF4358 domain-containing protein [Fusibacter bizertensis]
MDHKRINKRRFAWGIFYIALAGIIIIGINSKLSSSNDDVLKNAHDAIKLEYGDFYIPSKTITSESLSEDYGLNMSYVEDYIAESALMSTHADIFLGFKVKNGKVDIIKEELVTYKESLIELYKEDKVKLAKVEASEVIQYGNYVFYMVLGQNIDLISTDENEFLSDAIEEYTKGVKVLAHLFN